MDSLYWVNLNQTIKIEPTKKQYFNRYLWRLVYKIQKVNLATDPWVKDIINHVQEGRREERLHKKYALNGPSGSYNYYSYNQRREQWTGVDEVLVDRVRTVIRTYKDRVKFRAENNHLQIYAETERDLQDVAQAISCYEGMEIINIPRPGTEDALRNNVVFMNTIGYKYKVILRDGNYNVETKQSILEQLKARDDVKMPPNLRRELSKKYTALWGAYFYANDDSIVTILSLIAPGIVGKIHPIEQLQ